MECLCNHPVCSYSFCSFSRCIEIITFIGMKIQREQFLELFEQNRVFGILFEQVFESSRWDLDVLNGNHCEVNQHA